MLVNGCCRDLFKPSLLAVLVEFFKLFIRQGIYFQVLVDNFFFHRMYKPVDVLKHECKIAEFVRATSPFRVYVVAVDFFNCLEFYSCYCTFS